MTPRARKWSALGAIVGLMSTAAVSRYAASQASDPVTTATAARRELRTSVLASGNIVYEAQALLSPEVIGKITSVLVHEGDHVDRGQLLLTIEDRQLRDAVAQQSAVVRTGQLKTVSQQLSLADRERRLGRVSQLLQQGFATRSSFDDASYALQTARVDVGTSREDLNQAQALLHQTSEQLSKTVIRAPVSGTVIAVNIKVGETAVPSAIGIAGSNFMTIAQSDSMVAEMNVDEADIANIRAGQPALVHAAAFADRPLPAEVASVGLSPKRQEGLALPGAGGAARTYSVKLRLRNARGLLLRSGMSCRAEIYTSGAAKALAVPIQAVMTEDVRPADGHIPTKVPVTQESYVFVVANETAIRRRVKTGLSDDAYQEITAGLKPGEAVIVGPYKRLRFLVDGERVNAKTEQVF